MSESNEVTLSAGYAADLGVTGLGPTDSRRARRERSQAAVAFLVGSTVPGEGDLDDDEVDDDPIEVQPAETAPAHNGIVFSDEAAAARHHRLVSIAFQEKSPSMSQIFSN